jgi:hypothetical protein
MARYVTKVRSPLAPSEAFDFVADLRNLAVWDPGVRAVQQVAGDGPGADAAYDVTLNNPGPATTLRYLTLEFEAPTTTRVVASNRLLTSDDRITVEADPDGSGSIVTYDADLRLHGLLRLGDPVLGLVFRRIGDRAAAGLRTSLDGVRA